MPKFYEEGFDPDDISIKVSEMLVATADASDAMIDSAVTEVLRLLRERLKMDVVFVSELIDGERVFRYVDAPQDGDVLAVGDSAPAEESWCQRVVDGRLPEYLPDVPALAAGADLPQPPFDIGTHLSTPILLKGGEVYGTLCCLSHSVSQTVQRRDMNHLKSVATLVAQKIEKAHARDGAAKRPVVFAPASK